MENAERRRELVGKANRKYRAKDIEKARECTRDAMRRHAERNPGHGTASAGVNRALRLGAVPPELTRYAALEATLPIYRLAATLTATTGIKHEVDHTVPLALGGLHIPENLQVITAADHRRKSKADIKAIKEARNAARRQRRGW